MSWHNELKIAIVSKDPQKISTLIDTMPTFEKLEEMQEALYLFKEAYNVLNALRNETLSQREQVKKSIEFLESTASQQENAIDTRF